MNKKKFFITILMSFFFFVFLGAQRTLALETVIIQKPEVEELSYGEPLFESQITGGEANVPGSFFWKYSTRSFEIGTYVETIVFTPTDSSYDSVEIFVNVVVNKRRVFIKFEDEIYKQYDGTDSIKMPNYIVGGILKSDNIFIRGELESKLESALIGENNVILSGLELVGDKAKNYYLDLSGFKATVHPRFVEKFGSIKHKVEFSSEIFVPVNSLIYVDQEDSNSLKKEHYTIKSIYDVYLMNDGSIVDVDKEVIVKIQIPQTDLKYKRLNVFNYYNGVYESVDYNYENGYIIYRASSLGKLVITQKNIDFSWIYVVSGGVALVALLFIGTKIFSGKEKINKYKSKKRGKVYGS